MIEKSSQVVIKIKPKPLCILKVVAKSKKPLSSGDIEKRLLEVKTLRDKRDPQVYSIIKKVLCPQKFKYPFFLFDWNELVSAIKEAKKEGETSTFIRVRRTFGENFNSIGLQFDENTMEFTRADDNLIELKTNDSRIIKIERDSECKGHAVLKVFENVGKKTALLEEFDLVVRTVGKKKLITGGRGKEKSSNMKVQVFYNVILGSPLERGISYLKTSLNEKSQNESKIIRNIARQRAVRYHESRFTMPAEGQIMTTDREDSMLSEIEGNRSHWKYSLNTRGLILLILGIIEEEKRENGRVKNAEISNILENLSENFKKDFPYLMRYNEIKEIYDELAKKEKGYEYFQVRLLKQVALELQNIIDTIDTEELNYYVTKHYSTRLTIDHIRDANGLLRPQQGIPRAIKQYFVANLDRVKEYLDVELEDADRTIEAFLT
jgi:hypothetical protein